MLKRSLLMLAVIVLVLDLCGGCSPARNADPPRTVGEQNVDPPRTVGEQNVDLPADPLEERARQLLSEMTLEQKIGQMFLVRYTDDGHAAEEMARYQLAGYTLYKRDFQDRNGNWLTEQELAEKLAATADAANIPPFFAVDEEGGVVARASRNPNLFPEGKALPPRKVWQEQGIDALEAEARRINGRLLQLGLNVNLAPVADVVSDTEAFMYPRALEADPALTAELVAVQVSGMKAAGIGCVLKHFPGYGNNPDSHSKPVTDERPYERFAEADFLPFIAGIEAGADAVMLSHAVVTCLDAELPASLSPELNRVLRQELGFEGVIMTDDLLMIHHELLEGRESAALLAVKAGCDLLLTTSYRSEIDQLRAAVLRGEIAEARLDRSVLRVLKWKLRLGLLA